MKNGILNQLKQLEYDFCNKIILSYKKNVLSAKIKLHQFQKNVCRNGRNFFCHYFSFYDFAIIISLIFVCSTIVTTY